MLRWIRDLWSNSNFFLRMLRWQLHQDKCIYALEAEVSALRGAMNELQRAVERLNAEARRAPP